MSAAGLTDEALFVVFLVCTASLHYCYEEHQRVWTNPTPAQCIGNGIAEIRDYERDHAMRGMRVHDVYCRYERAGPDYIVEFDFMW